MTKDHETVLHYKVSLSGLMVSVMQSHKPQLTARNYALSHQKETETFIYLKIVTRSSKLLESFLE